MTGYNLDYKEGHKPLVLLGLRLGDLTLSGRTWCYSDRNAAANIVRFGTDITALPDFIDFDLMCETMWSYTRDDPDRPARRAAEVLVLGHAPISLVTAVVCAGEETLSGGRAILGHPGDRSYWVIPSFLYQ